MPIAVLDLRRREVIGRERSKDETGIRQMKRGACTHGVKKNHAKYAASRGGGRRSHAATGDGNNTTKQPTSTTNIALPHKFNVKAKNEPRLVCFFF